MARFFITNRQDWAAAAQRLCRLAKHLEFTTHEFHLGGQAFQITCYQKLSFPEPNFAKGEVNWVASVGTALGPTNTGQALLRSLLQREPIELGRVREDILGHYNLISGSDSEVRVCSDPMGGMPCYYYSSQDDFFVSNTLHVISESIGCSANADGLLSRAVLIGNVGRDTMFSGIKRLFPNEELVLSARSPDATEMTFRGLKTFSDRIAECRVGPTPTFESAMNTLSELVEDCFGRIQHVSPKARVGVFATGGADSRGVMSGLASVDITPILYHGSGNSDVTRTRSEDRQCVLQLSEILGSIFCPMDWRGFGPRSPEHQRHIYSRLGIHASHYGASEGFITALEGGLEPYPSVILGGQCPVFTNASLPINSGQFELQDMVDLIGVSWLSNRPSLNRERFRAQLVERFREELIAANIIDTNKDSLDLESFLMGHLYLYHFAETQLAWLMNQFTHFVSPFCTHKIFPFLMSLPHDYRRDSRLQMALVTRYSPDLHKVPYFSGIQEKVYNEDSGLLTLKRVEEELAQTGLRSRVRSLLPKSVLAAKRSAFDKIRETRLKHYSNWDYRDRSWMHQRVTRHAINAVPEFRDVISSGAVDLQVIMRIRDLLIGSGYFD